MIIVILLHLAKGTLLSHNGALNVWWMIIFRPLYNPPQYSEAPVRKKKKSRIILPRYPQVHPNSSRVDTIRMLCFFCCAHTICKVHSSFMGHCPHLTYARTYRVRRRPSSCLIPVGSNIHIVCFIDGRKYQMMSMPDNVCALLFK